MIAMIVETVFAISGPSCTCSGESTVSRSTLNTATSSAKPTPPTRANFHSCCRSAPPGGIRIPCSSSRPQPGPAESLEPKGSRTEDAPSTSRGSTGERMAFRVGVIGGGQLARMMVPAAVELGIDLAVLAEAPDAAARIAATAVGDCTDVDTVLAFASGVDVVTFDHEHVPQAVLAALVDAGVAVRPGPEALRHAQDKLVLRERLEALGIRQPAWGRGEVSDDLEAFLDGTEEARAIVKT